MNVWGVGLSSVPYSSLVTLVTFREISCSLFYVALVGPELLSHTEAIKALPPGPASHHSGLLRVA